MSSGSIITPNYPVIPPALTPQNTTSKPFPTASISADPVAFSPMMPIDPMLNSTSTRPLSPTAPSLYTTPAPVIYTAPRILPIDNLEKLEKRWIPRQLFNLNAPPQDQIASPLKFGFLAWLISGFIPYFILSLPIGIAAGIWQNQRNADAIDKLRRTPQMLSVRQQPVVVA